MFRNDRAPHGHNTVNISTSPSQGINETQIETTLGMTQALGIGARPRPLAKVGQSCPKSVSNMSLLFFRLKQRQINWTHCLQCCALAPFARCHLLICLWYVEHCKVHWASFVNRRLGRQIGCIELFCSQPNSSLRTYKCKQAVVNFIVAVMLFDLLNTYKLLYANAYQSCFMAWISSSEIPLTVWLGVQDRQENSSL